MRNPLVGRVTSEWDLSRKHPVFKTVQPHHGIDIGAPVGVLPYKYVGADVRAAYAGTVARVKTNWSSGWGAIWGRSGNGVLIRNPDGEHQYYGHLSRVDVKVGQKVSEGQVLGGMGASGNVTGPHLHLEFHTKYSNDSNNWQRTRNPRVDFNAAGITPGVDSFKWADSSPNSNNPEETTLSAAEVKEIKDYIKNQADRIVDYIAERTTVEVIRSGKKVPRSAHTILAGLDENVGSLVYPPEKTVSWHDTISGEVKEITVEKALENLSVLAGRESKRDENLKATVEALINEEELVKWRDSSTGEIKKVSVATALGNLSLHWARALKQTEPNETGDVK